MGGMEMDSPSAGGNFTRLNHDTPMVWLTSMDAEFTTRNRDIFVASLAIMVWDVAWSLSEDYDLFFRHKWAWQTLAYVLSRVSTLMFLTLAVISETLPVSHCAEWAIANRAFYVISHASIGLLFLFRVCAVYNFKRSVVGFFTFAWLAVIAGAALSFLSVTGEQIGPTKYCYLWISGSEKYIIATVTTQAVFDLLVCVAVSYKLGSTVVTKPTDLGTESKRTWTRCIVVTNTGLQWLTEKFLQESQRYFLLAAVFKIPEIVAFFSVHREHGADICLSISFPDTAIMSIIAAKIYRGLKLGGVSVRSKPQMSLTSLSFSSRAYVDNTPVVSVEKETEVFRSFPPVVRPVPPYDPYHGEV